MVSKDFFLFVCVCVCVWASGKSQMNQSAIITSANLVRWMDGQTYRIEKNQYTVCVCVCGRTYARLLCRDRWLIECRAKWVSVYACEQRWGAGGAALTLELSQQMEDGKGHRL